MNEPDGPGNHKVRNPLISLMHAMGERMVDQTSGENRRAVLMAARMGRLRDAIPHSLRRKTWPVTAGAYSLGDPQGPVAVCTLTSGELFKPAAALPGVAIAGRVYTPNLGIEKIIRNINSNPNIRFLLLVGKESPVFWVGQALRNLFEKGITAERRIRDADGHYPVLINLKAAEIEGFQKQVELVNRTELLDLAEIGELTRELALRNPGRFEPVSTGLMTEVAPEQEERELDSLFKPLRPGGHREPLVYDPKGFMIISIDRARQEIVLRHYLPDHTPAHIMRGRSAEPILLGLLREGLVTQLTHATYLGVELTKAELALRTNRPYEQDKPLGKLIPLR